MERALAEGETGWLERKFHRPAAGLQLGEGARISGYASRFGEVDRCGDVVMRGAYRAALVAAAGQRGEGAPRGVKMLWQHDPSQPIGVWDEIREDDTGLWVSGRLLTEVARGREAAALVAAGAVDGLSIGYRTKRAERGPGGQRLLTEVELWEVSLVTFPMLESARVVHKEADLTVVVAALTRAVVEARQALSAGSDTGSHGKRG